MPSLVVLAAEYCWEQHEYTIHAQNKLVFRCLEDEQRFMASVGGTAPVSLQVACRPCCVLIHHFLP